MKTNTSLRLVGLSVACLAGMLSAGLAQTTYTNSASTSGTYYWADGTSSGWNALPVSGAGAILKLGNSATPLAAGTTMTFSNNIGSAGTPFVLSSLDLSGLNSVTTTSVAIVTITGNPLEFTSYTYTDSNSNVVAVGPSLGATATTTASTVYFRANIILDTTTTFSGWGKDTVYFYNIISGVGGLSIQASNNFLYGKNTFSGGIDIQNAATITASYSSDATSGAFGTGAIRFNGSTGGKVDTIGGNLATTSFNNAITLNGTAQFGVNSATRGAQTWNGAVTVTTTGATITNNLYNNLALTFNGNIGDDGGANRSLTFTGGFNATSNNSYTIVNGNNTYTGGTYVTNTTGHTGEFGVFFNGTNTSPTVTVSNAIIGGTGSVGNIVMAATGGKVAPGGVVSTSSLSAVTYTTGHFTATSFNASLATTTVSFQLQLNSSSDYDQFIVTGASGVNFGSQSYLSLSVGNGTFNMGDVLLLINNENSSSLTSVFQNYANGDIFTLNGVQFEIYYGANFDNSGNFISLTGGNDVAVQVVPEPAAWALMLVGLGMAGLARRRRPAT